MPEKKRIERHRTFIAIKVQDRLKKELAKVQRYLEGECDVLRFTKPDELHITLAFLGGLSAEVQNVVIILCQRIAQTVQPFTLHPTQLGAFPRMNRPSVVWVGLGGETSVLTRLVYELEGALKQRHISPAIHVGGYVPHLSIGNVSRKQRRGNLRAVRELLEQTELSLSDIEIPVTEILVYQSNPISHGPKYTTLAKIKLGRDLLSPQ